MSTSGVWRWSLPSAVIAYGLAFLSVTAALTAALLLDRYLQTMPYVSLLLCAIMFSAWFGGLGPSLFATVIAAFYFTFFLVDPDSFNLAATNIPRVALFVLTALFVVWLSNAQRRSTEELARVNQALRAENAERRRTEAHLDQAQALSRTGSFGWKVRTGELFFSKEARRLLDVDRDRIPRDALERLGSDGFECEYERPWRTAAGAQKHLHVRAHRMRFEGGEDEVVGAVMDVTETREAQQALQATQAALAHAARVATLGEISASIAHEVNQPLAGIVTNGEAGLRWLKRDKPDLGEAKSAMERMIRDARRASEVVQHLRALARKAPAERRPIDLNEAITESIRLLEHEIHRHRAVLRTDLAPDLPRVLADRIELQQVVINLMVNGMQAMDCVSDRPRQLVVRSGREAGQALVAVEDSGKGLDPAAAGRLFTPFYTTRPDGMGMGLSICRSIIEAHGGRIWSTANDGPGATFRFTLPLEPETVS